MPIADLSAVARAIPVAPVTSTVARPSAGQRACQDLLNAFGDGAEGRVTSAGSVWRQQYESTLRSVYSAAGYAEAAAMVECLVQAFEARGFDWSLVRNALEPSLDAIKQQALVAASTAVTSAVPDPTPSAPAPRPPSLVDQHCALLLSKIPFDAGTAPALKHVASTDWQQLYATLLYQTMLKAGPEAGGALFVCLIQGISTKAGANPTDVGNIITPKTREVSQNFLATHDTAPPVTSGGPLVEPPVFTPSEPPVPPTTPPSTAPEAVALAAGRWLALAGGVVVGYAGGYLLGRVLRR